MTKLDENESRYRMRYSDLLHGVQQELSQGSLATEIQALSYDSRVVPPKSLFIAMQGFHVDGHRFIEQAIERGAAAVLYEDPSWDERISVPAVRVANARVALAPIAAVFYGSPGQKMRTIGITGTDGKTTTTYLTSVALEAAQYVTGFMGTVDFKVADRLWSNETRQSTPEAPEVQALLRDMVAAGCSHAVIEATSHALSARWNRLGGCAFDIAVLTNVTHEHLDFHGSVEQYRRDKMRLFEMLGENDQGAPAHHQLCITNKHRKIAIVNADDPYHQMFLDAAPAQAERLTYAVRNHGDVRADKIVTSRDGLHFQVTTPWGQRQVQLRLTGDFNIHNALAALTVALAEGVDIDLALAALSQVPGVRGRMERVDQGQPFTVLVDYAHTPGSFEKLMRIVRPLTDGRLIAVFGSAGERDREKRPIQGETAAQFCDLVVLTDEDPRFEDRHTIIAEIAKGVEQANRSRAQPCTCLQIPDRSQAIRAALAEARPGDIVLLLGKGHERCIIYGADKTPWDEAAEARAALVELGYSRGQ
jgi:UDP-N-acetylmuramoyl-L-alanyl-D-glutamate--2,6-diaminopimelate ligase